MLTRQDLIIKWTTFAVASLLLLSMHTLIFGGLRLLGVRQFLPPLLVGVVASMEDGPGGMIYGLSAGVLCDLCVAGVFPCVYTLSFTTAALLCSMLAKSVLQPGVICSLTVSALVFAVTDALSMLGLLFTGRTALLPMLDVALRELAASGPLLLIVHPAVGFLHRKFTI